MNFSNVFNIRKKNERNLGQGYNFSEKAELKNYKKAGKKKNYENYCAWESSIETQYDKITEVKFFINFKAYLKKRYELYEQRHEMATSLWIPLLTLLISFALVIPPVFISLKQYQDNIQNTIDDTYLTNMVVTGMDIEEQIPQQVKILQNRVDQCESTINYVFALLFFAYAILVIIGIILSIVLKRGLTKIAFYKDYTNVIDKIISDFPKDGD